MGVRAFNKSTSNGSRIKFLYVTYICNIDNTTKDTQNKVIGNSYLREKGGKNFCRMLRSNIEMVTSL